MNNHCSVPYYRGIFGVDFDFADDAADELKLVRRTAQAKSRTSQRKQDRRWRSMNKGDTLSSFIEAGDGYNDG